MPQGDPRPRPIELHDPAAAGLGSQRYLHLFEQLAPLIGATDADQIAVRACQLTADLLAVEACSLLLVDDTATRLRLAAATHIDRRHWPEVSQPLDEGVCGEVWRTRGSLLIKGREQFRRHFGREPDVRYQTPSCALVPLVFDRECLGVINIAQPLDRRAFEPRDLELLEAAARLITGALANARHMRQIRRLNRNLQDIFDNILVGVLSVDDQGRITQTNRHARILLGLEPETAEADLSMDRLLPGSVSGVCRRLIRQAEHEGRPIQERLKVEIAGRSVGLQITVSHRSSVSLALSEDLIMFEDIGQAEEVARLREAERMKRLFLATVSHELRTPLAVIRGSLPLIDPHQEGGADAETLHQVYHLIDKNSQRLTDVVNSVFDVVEIESGTMRLTLRPVRIAELLRDVMEAFDERIRRKRLTADVDYPPQDLELVGDERRLNQVLREVIGNAVKFADEGGRISIVSRVADGALRLSVSNTGATIDPVTRRNLFTKFHQGDPSSTRVAGGCGLGLFLVQNILQLHRGYIELREALEERTTFVVHLPLGHDQESGD